MKRGYHIDFLSFFNFFESTWTSCRMPFWQNWKVVLFGPGNWTIVVTVSEMYKLLRYIRSFDVVSKFSMLCLYFWPYIWIFNVVNFIVIYWGVILLKNYIVAASNILQNFALYPNFRWCIRILDVNSKNHCFTGVDADFQIVLLPLFQFLPNSEKHNQSIVNVI